MKKVIWCVMGLLVCAYLGAQAFSLSKTEEDIKVDDVIFAVRVPVIEGRNLRPDLPRIIRELRKTDVVLYDSDDIDKTQFAIVVMVVPAENAAEMTKRLSEHPSIEVLSEQEVRDNKAVYKQCERVFVHLKNRVRFALTPYKDVADFN